LLSIENASKTTNALELAAKLLENKEIKEAKEILCFLFDFFDLFASN